MNNKIYDIDDRVRCVNTDNLDLPIIMGKCGIVKNFNFNSIGVEFDENVGGHDLGGYCTYGHGWFLLPGQLELVKKIEPISEADFKDILFG